MFLVQQKWFYFLKLSRMQEKWLNGPVLTECLAQGQIPRTNIKKWDHMITWTLALLWGRMRRSLRIAEYWSSSRFNEILCLDYGRLRPRGQTTSEFAVSLSPRNVKSDPRVSTIWPPEHEPSKGHTSRHSRVDGRKITELQPYTKSYRQLMWWAVVLRARAHQLVIQYQMFTPEKHIDK